MESELLGLRVHPLGSEEARLARKCDLQRGAIGGGGGGAGHQVELPDTYVGTFAALNERVLLLLAARGRRQSGRQQDGGTFEALHELARDSLALAAAAGLFV